MPTHGKRKAAIGRRTPATERTRKARARARARNASCHIVYMYNEGLVNMQTMPNLKKYTVGDEPQKGTSANIESCDHIKREPCDQINTEACDQRDTGSCDQIDMESCDHIKQEPCDQIDIESCDHIKREPCDQIDIESCDHIKQEPCDQIDIESCDHIKQEPCDQIDIESCDYIKREPCDQIDIESCDHINQEPCDQIIESSAKIETDRCDMIGAIPPEHIKYEPCGQDKMNVIFEDTEMGHMEYELIDLEPFYKASDMSESERVIKTDTQDLDSGMLRGSTAEYENDRQLKTEMPENISQQMDKTECVNLEPKQSDFAFEGVAIQAVKSVSESYFNNIDAEPSDYPVIQKSTGIVPSGAIPVDTFRCKYCDKAFTQQSCLIRHEFTHTDEKQFQCGFCKETFIQESFWRSHVSSCIYNSTESSKSSSVPTVIQVIPTVTHVIPTVTHVILKCKYCKSVFFKTSDWSEHEDKCKERFQGKTAENAFKCKYCEMAFPDEVGCVAHESIHTGAAEKPFKCKLCQTCCVPESVWRSHVSSCISNSTKSSSVPTPTSKKPFRSCKCKYCPRRFPDEIVCKRHESECSYISATPLKCKYCNSVFFQKRLRFEHEEKCKEHFKFTTVKCTVKCKYCALTCSFLGKSAWREHEDKCRESFKSKTGVDVLNCKHCNMCFWEVSRWREHESKCHECEGHLKNKPKSRPVNTFKCKICEMYFHSEKELRLHIIGCYGVELYKCRYCGKGFGFKAYWIAHERVCNDLQLYSCTGCKVRFYEEAYQKMHERSCLMVKIAREKESAKTC